MDRPRGLTPMPAGSKRRYFLSRVCQTRSLTLTNPNTHHHASVFFCAREPTRPSAPTARPSASQPFPPCPSCLCCPTGAFLQSSALEILRRFSPAPECSH